MKNLQVFFFVLLLLAQACSQKPIEQKEVGYTEKYRPQYHFSPAEKWMNDPNGMVYFDGEYHLFYQHFPDGNTWGPMHWGHAISTDLTKWEHLPIALYPDSLGLIFSGSAVIDWDNTTGFGSKEKPAMVAIYTNHSLEGERGGRDDFQTQSIAYSTDKGRTWTKYTDNPVIKNPGIRDFRDPKVIWDKQSKKWIMALAMQNKIGFFSSPNLKTWTKESEFGENIGAHGGVWECPDLFPMYVDGGAVQKWVLLVSINPGGYNGGSATQYFIGDFDGHEFMLDTQSMPPANNSISLPEGTLLADFEQDNYANWTTQGTAFANAPAKGALPNQNSVMEYVGNGLVNSFFNGDSTTGKLISPEFTIDNEYINFKIGGGGHANLTCINLLVDNQVVRTTTGANNERLSWNYWHVGSIKGQKAKIEIVDAHKEGWGHINVDHIIQSNKPALNNQSSALWLDFGTDNYAGVTWSDIPSNDSRRLFIGWMSNWDYAQTVPTEKWRSAMTVPRSIKLTQTQAGYRLVATPVDELKTLRVETQAIPISPVKGLFKIDSPLLEQSNGLFEIEMTFDLKEATRVSLTLANDSGEYIELYYDVKAQEIVFDRAQAGESQFHGRFASKIMSPFLVPEDNKLTLHLLMDWSSSEVFVNGGKVQMTNLIFPSAHYTSLAVKSDGEVELAKGNIWKLKSIW